MTQIVLCHFHGWGGRIRTCECWYQKPVPYHLATPQYVCIEQIDFNLFARYIQIFARVYLFGLIRRELLRELLVVGCSWQTKELLECFDAFIV